MISCTTVPFIDLVIQYRSISTKIDQAIADVLSQCNFILGKQVEAFEHSFADFVHVQHAIGVGSGLDALRLALVALNIGFGDEVIIPANTYIATALAVTSVGARPVLVDCDPCTYSIDVNKIERAITPQTRAIIPVHLTGQAADMDPILDLAASYQLRVVEDSAQAHGTLYRGRPCGSMGDTGCFSFYPGKNLGAFGDGGLVTTNDALLAGRMRRLRNYGQQQKYDHTEKGFNTRLDTIQAAILSVKLGYLNEWNMARSAHAETYRSRLQGQRSICLQKISPYSNHIWHIFMIETEQRDELQQYLLNHGIQTGIHYPKPIHLQRAYVDLGYSVGDFPESERLASRILSLPMFPELTDEQIHFVCDSVVSFLQERRPLQARAVGSS
jgi:dTDP-3-amino-3,4,6-trideoxy-alpha-D-glucose transaminase